MEKIPTLSREKLVELLEFDSIEQMKRDGISPQHIQTFCKKYNISHYALDIERTCFFKHIATNNNYKPLMYYMMNSHLYPVVDEKTRKILSHSLANAGNGQSLNALVNKDLASEKKQDEKLEQLKRFEDLPLHEGIAVKDIGEYKDCNIFYRQQDLHNIWIQLFEKTNTQYETKMCNGFVERIYYDNNVWLLSNTNHKSGRDWTNSMKACKLFDIPFDNQSLQGVANHVFSSFHVNGGKKHEREIFTKDFRLSIAKEQGFKCVLCQCSIKTYFEVDHIKSLGCGGNNERENLQAICKDCHKTKTNLDSAERLFNHDNTISSYNIQVAEIFKRSKNGFIHNFINPLAVEHLVEKKKKVLFGLDLNKCRKNIVLTNEDEYCVFSILDNIESFDCEFNEHKKIPTGYYFVETMNLLPFKGNGWHCQTLVRYAIKEKIIGLENIKFVIRPSVTLRPDYFNKFVNFIYGNEALDDKDKKLSVNAFIGMLGSKVNKTQTCILTESLNDVSYHFFKNDGCFIKKHEHEETKAEYYEVIKRKETYKTENHCPIFNQILDIEAMELHKIAKKLKAIGGEIIYANTDNCVAMFDPMTAKALENCKYLSETWDKPSATSGKQGKVLKYKIENKICKHDREEKINSFSETFAEPEWNIIEDTTDDFTVKAKELIALDSSFQSRCRKIAYG